MFLGTVAMVRRGLTDVIGQRSRVTRTLKEHIVSRDAIRERELSAVFKALHEELPRWVANTPVRTTCRVELIPESVPALRHVRERFWDPADHLPPEPLIEQPEVDTANRYRSTISAGKADQSSPGSRSALAGADPGAELTAGTVFDLMDIDAKRPVEVLGLIHLLARAAALAGAEDHERVETHRTDGTRRMFAIPRVTLTPERVDQIGEVEVG